MKWKELYIYIYNSIILKLFNSSSFDSIVEIFELNDLQFFYIFDINIIRYKLIYIK